MGAQQPHSALCGGCFTLLLLFVLQGFMWMRGMDCAGSSQPCLPAAASCSLSQLGLKAVPGASEVPPLPWKVFITVLFVLLGEMISL